ncbi:hypothetical protein TREMEDRAFT_65159 [Tremella mesenterica DSM 1558]|uniref:uncharacterized protein n=1 Tax=Tremella mesenterica (strain ATCC 24925 / CBS 8224 / DSM 1558 / NBRC 9311 / NRRL Y-6157 / RJB 2259-6 / UBC 559-6) TaxID=578456 RepID=UPI00032C4291|nr:uncharacterized protein TREMEDRAFT_65159 [Tremella mesenterica DSM 1558]EIW66760.1 hypothetical protein TREMEDRAFT_65159 [Tremella mesenterica DSM 1558]
MLLARVHIQLQIWQVAGRGQTKYAGHTCLFARDNTSLISRLPILPAQLDILIIKDKQAAPSNVEAFSRRPEFQVSRSRLLDNLLALRRFHPAYSEVEIDHEVLATLPEQGSVFDQLRSTSVDNTSPRTDIPDFGDEGREDIILEAVIPNVGSALREVEETRTRLEEIEEGIRAPLTAPALRPTPLYEHDKTSQHLVQAFPFLFPQGLADLHASRQSEVKPNDYFKHLMKFHDGRFASHPRFRYYAFNALLRWQARSLASYYSRGSGHVHGLLWLEDAPRVENLKGGGEEVQNEFINFWQNKVWAINPCVNLPRAPQHPSSRPHADMTYNHTSLAEHLNRVQRHTRCSRYCLKRPKGSDPSTEPICRFRFPRDLCDTPSLHLDERGTLQLLLPRNDSLLNLYNPVFTLGWQANVDIQPCTDPHAVANYVAKYASKAEKPSLAFGDVMQAIANQVEEETSSRVIFQKMLSKVLTERDYSAQEVCHSLLDCNMMSASRDFRTLCLLPSRSRRLQGQREDDEEVEDKDWYDQYLQREHSLTDVSLYTWYKRYEKRQGNIVYRQKNDRIIRLWPMYHPSHNDSEEYELWCRSRLLLHHPHRQESDLLDDGETWGLAYERCKETHLEGHEDTLPKRSRRQMGEGEDEIEDEFSSDDDDDNDVAQELEDWHLMCQEGGRRQVEVDITQRLGLRDMDKAKDWHECSRQWGVEGLDERIQALEDWKKTVSSLASSFLH